MKLRPIFLLALALLSTAGVSPLKSILDGAQICELTNKLLFAVFNYG